MGIGSITGHIDAAQVVLYTFWIFFAGLIFYLRREDHREGYPLTPDKRFREGRPAGERIFPSMPAAKEFLRRDGQIATMPSPKAEPEFKAVRSAEFPGAPLDPVGNPMLAGVGPGAWAQRADTPELTWEGQPQIVPMRVEPELIVSSHDFDPRGLPVKGADGVQAGTVSEIWGDRSEPQIRYLEVQLEGDARTVLLPRGFARIRRNEVRVQSINAVHFADVPAITSPDQVTKLEEDKITAYYASGNLYADPGRKEPIL